MDYRCIFENEETNIYKYDTMYRTQQCHSRLIELSESCEKINYDLWIPYIVFTENKENNYLLCREYILKELKTTIYIFRRSDFKIKEFLL